MTDIPEDVMKAAADCYEALPLVYDGWDEDAVRLGIAQAILAERERSAVSADRRGKELGEVAIGSDIANTIRDGL